MKSKFNKFEHIWGGAGVLYTEGGSGSCTEGAGPGFYTRGGGGAGALYRDPVNRQTDTTKTLPAHYFVNSR